jgi:very-short-patch-repair endonuclease/predicted  nucleic acid-binding Zn-ribbon protein
MPAGRRLVEMPERKEPEDYHRVARARGASWDGPEVANANTRTGWECLGCGRKWQAIYNSLQRGRACPDCGIRKRSDTQRAKPEDYRRLADHRGFTWEGPTVRSAFAKTGWRCPNGHAWRAAYSKVKGGSGCPVCAAAARDARAVADRHDAADYRALARRRGFAWDGPEVAHANAKTTWRCPAGHAWEATYNKILHGRGCPSCAPAKRAGKLRRKPADYRALAAARGMEWIGPEASGYLEGTGWRCARGHTWTAAYTAIQRGYGCPECGSRVNGKPVSQVQRALARRLRGELNHRVGRRCIDVAIERAEVRIAVEYDAWFWHASTQAADATRDAELIALGWRVLRIRSAYALPDPAELGAAISRLVHGEERTVITLPDWGVGRARGEAYEPGRKPRPYRRREAGHGA